MTEKTRFFVQRRAFAGGALFTSVGLGAGWPLDAIRSSRVIPEASLVGPYLDLTDAFDGATGLARLTGNLRGPGERYGAFEGAMVALAPSGELRSFCGLRGFSVARLVPRVTPAGWTLLCREVGMHYDLATGRHVDAMINPFTGARVRVTDTVLEWEREISATNPPLRWRIEADRLLGEQSQRLHASNPLTERGSPGSELRPFPQTEWHVASLDDMQNRALPLIRSVGGWTRSAPWPSWLDMDAAPGHCLYQCTFAGGYHQPDLLPGPILSRALAFHERWLTAPGEFASATQV